MLLSFFVQIQRGKVENLGFSSFFIGVFYFILVSLFGVPLYASHSSAEDFRSKSVCPRAVVFRRNQIKKRQDYKHKAPAVFFINADNSDFLGTFHNSGRCFLYIKSIDFYGGRRVKYY